MHKQFSLKTKRHLLIILSSFLLFNNSLLIAQDYWFKAIGPAGGAIYAIEINSNGDILAGTDGGGIFLSTDNAQNWIPTNTGLTDMDIRAIAYTPNGDVFAGTWGGGVFYSSNMGNDWTAKNNGLPDFNLHLNTITVTAAGTALAALALDGLYRSFDNGGTWERDLESPFQVSAFAYNSNEEIFAAGADGVFRSNNDGDSWSEISPASISNVRSVAVDADDDLFAATWSDGLFRSIDNGVTWTKTTLTAPHLISLAINSNGHVFAGTTEGNVYHSQNNGDSWAELTTTFAKRDIRVIETNPQDELFVGSSVGVLYSADTGQTWENRSNGIGATQVNSLLLNENDQIFAGTSNGVFKSPEENRWAAASVGLSNPDVRALAINSQGDLFAGTYGNGVFRSEDNGDSWQETGLTDELVISLAVDLQDNIYAGTAFNGLFRSVNNGENWEPAGLDGTIRAISVNSDNTIFAGALGVFRSDSLGTSWVKIGNGPDTWSLTSDNNGKVFAGGSAGAVYQLDSDREVWVDTSFPFNHTIIRALVSNSNNHIFAATRDFGVFFYNYTNNSYTQINSGLSSLSFLSLATDSKGFLYAGSRGNGIFKSNLSTTLFFMPDRFVHFDSLKVGRAISDSILVRNRGTTELNISSVYSTDSSFSVTPGFANIAVEDSQYFEIRFHPKNYGLLSGKIIFESNANTSPDEAVLSGVGLAPFLNFPVTSIDFPATPIGLTTDTTVVIINNGNEALSIDYVLVSDDHFAFISSNMEIPPSQSGEGLITFSPDTLGAYQGQMVFYSNSLSSPDTLWVSGSSIITAVENQNIVPKKFSLEQNYPNPFNPETHITYQIPKPTHVKIMIHNINGKLVRVLVDRKLDIGFYDVVWNARDASGKKVASGIYLLTIRANEYRDIKRMVLLK